MNIFSKTIRENVKYPNCNGEYGKWDSMPFDRRKFLIACADYMDSMDVLVENYNKIIANHKVNDKDLEIVAEFCTKTGLHDEELSKVLSKALQMYNTTVLKIETSTDYLLKQIKNEPLRCIEVEEPKVTILKPVVVDLTLKEFVTKFICKNSLIRLWIKTSNTCYMLKNDTNDKSSNSVCMEWELLKGNVWQSEYNDYKVLGINDIVVNDFYKEAINIVIYK